MIIELASIGNVLKDLLIIVGLPVVRSASGWAVKALADNRVTRFEWKQLAQTVIRVGTIGLMGYFGLSIAGIENAALASAIGAFFVDKIFNALKQTKPIRQ